jgi:glycosyltransferase involved in cell wall biosynthesis
MLGHRIRKMETDGLDSMIDVPTTAGATRSTPDLSVVLGTLNRKRLLQHTLRSIRENGFDGILEIIVVDGGSTDGTCDWLATQRDVLTFVQPNYWVPQPNGERRRARSWGEFMNMGFRAASAPWILMISDDLLVCPGAIETGITLLRQRMDAGEQIGGGAMFYREYPRDLTYHVKLLPGRVIHINHGFFNKTALEAVDYANETDFEFYGADGDLSMRLNFAGWKTIPLEGAYAEHLMHRSPLRRLVGSGCPPASVHADMSLFATRYQHLEYSEKTINVCWQDPSKSARRFWHLDALACCEGVLRRCLGK